MRLILALLLASALGCVSLFIQDASLKVATVWFGALALACDGTGTWLLLYGERRFADWKRVGMVVVAFALGLLFIGFALLDSRAFWDISSRDLQYLRGRAASSETVPHA